MITDEDLIRYNSQGLIPSPEEEESEFLARVEKAQNIKNYLFSEDSPIKGLFQESSALPLASINFDEIYATTKALYDMEPKWIPIFFDNYKLAFWHGGSAWIFQEHEGSPKEAFLQIRKEISFFYKREEIIAHEMAHIGRMAFDEPHFEEILAYRTSQKKWRKWLGPVVQTGWGSSLFVGLLGMIIAFDSIVISFGMYEFMEIAMWLKIIPIAMIVYTLFRLVWLHTVFNRCLAKLQSIFKNTLVADAVIYRLSDAEIYSFAKIAPEAIEKYIDDNSELSLRWRLIRAAYKSSSCLRGA